MRKLTILGINNTGYYDALTVHTKHSCYIPSMNSFRTTVDAPRTIRQFDHAKQQLEC